MRAQAYLGVQNARRSVEEGTLAYAHAAATDFSVAVSQQLETKRLDKLEEEAKEQVAAAQALADKRKYAMRGAKLDHLHALERSKRLLLRRDAAVLALYLPVRRYLAAYTTAPVTFSAPNKAAAAQAKKELAAGNARGENETVPAKMDAYSGNVIVELRTATKGARIFYSLEPWDKNGNAPRIDERSASCTSGGKVTLTKTGHVTAFASFGTPNPRPRTPNPEPRTPQPEVCIKALTPPHS